MTVGVSSPGWLEADFEYGGTGGPRVAVTAADAARQRELNARVSTLLRRASAVMEQRKSRSVAPFGLSLNQYVAMLWLRCNPRASNARLARWCDITPQAASALVSALQQRGLVVRDVSAAHGRLLEISLTRRGIRVLDQADRAATEVEQLYAAEFADDELKLFRDLLERSTTTLT
jgi:DNA-binding MarR family transcriptional regulator